jgi:hypothetical protein
MRALLVVMIIILAGSRLLEPVLTIRHRTWRLRLLVDTFFFFGYQGSLNRESFEARRWRWR